MAPELPWLLLLPQLPPRPASLRVKVWRRLQALGALPLKNGVHALPNPDEAREDFEWVLRELAKEGGEGSLCEARLLEGLTDEAVQSSFRSARERDYAEIGEAARRLARGVSSPRAGRLGSARRARIEAELGRLRKRLEEIERIDFFGAPGREPVEGLLGGIEQRLVFPEDGGRSRRKRDWKTSEVEGSRWVTRKGVHVDRMASAWLIRRFIDPRPSFRFVAGRSHTPEPGELRFDMFEGEFSHDGELCTFEVLLREFGLGDPALRPIAEIVHDIDLKESRFGRAETPGIDHLVAGLAWAHAEDERRLDASSALFDGLYAYFRRRKE